MTIVDLFLVIVIVVNTILIFIINNTVIVSIVFVLRKEGVGVLLVCGVHRPR